MHDGYEKVPGTAVPDQHRSKFAPLHLSTNAQVVGGGQKIQATLCTEAVAFDRSHVTAK
jgi:ABC-type sulfate transport system substrate-binding protein